MRSPTSPHPTECSPPEHTHTGAKAHRSAHRDVWWRTRTRIATHTRAVLCAAIICTAICLIPNTASAQPESVQRLQQQFELIEQEFRFTVDPDQPISERLLLDVAGQIRLGWYSIDDAESDAHQLLQTDAQLSIRGELDGAHRFFGRLRFLYNDWGDGDSFDGRGDYLEHSVGDRYWYQFDLRGAVQADSGERIDHNVNIKVGRQWIHWASGLALSKPLYAALLDIEVADVGFVGLASFTPEESIIDFDGSRPGYDTQTQRSFFGGMLEYRGSSTHTPYAYVLSQIDNNDQDFATFTGPGGAFPTAFEYDSTYAAVGSRGTLTDTLFYRIEGIYEFGQGKSNSFDDRTLAPIAQSDEDISAFAGVLGLSLVPGDEFTSRFDLEVLIGTGDDDRIDSADTFGGNRPGTDDTSFNAFGYADTGLALTPELANLLSLRLGWSANLFPNTASLDRARFGIKGFLFHKLDSDAPISVPTNDNGFIGGEADLAFDWAITSDVSLNLRYGIFFPGEAMIDDEDDIRQFFYAGVTYAF